MNPGSTQSSQPPGSSLRVRAIIFDLDDTLYCERDYVFSGYQAVARQFADRLGDAADVEARLRALYDTPQRSRVFNAIVAEVGTDEAVVPEMIAAYRGHAPTLQLYADAERALARYAGRVKLGVISDGWHAVQAAKAKALGIQTRVDRVLLTDTWGRAFWKPHPRAFETMALELGVEHGACVYVADNPAKDFVAPNALGWNTVQVRRPVGVYRDTAAATGGAAHHVVDSLDQLDDCFGLNHLYTDR